ncbi:tetratricopeptide repeat protein [Catenulispora yoronensis]|uniref:tetratricopeptide repeat protein n=1 Tax=Catenulispora yoronensis TaxID=450799 RepID=UPI0031DFE856
MSGGRVGIVSVGPDAVNIYHAPPPTSLPPVGRVPVPAGLSNVPRRGMFIGRDREMERLADAMFSGSGVVTQAVAGLGGMGKSTLAAEYARRYADRYVGVWWLTADSRASVETGLADLVRRLIPSQAADHDGRVLSDWGLSWVQSTPGLLLVWDNVDDVQDVAPLLAAASGDVHHLVTSRLEGDWHLIDAQPPLRLGELAPQDAVRLLTRIVGSTLDEHTAAALCAELGYLPLAVEQVGAYLAKARTDPGEYLALWRTAQAQALASASAGSRVDQYMTGVWKITLDKLADIPLAGDLLRVMAWFAPEAISRELLRPLAEPDELDRALLRLNAYSMVTLDPSGRAINVHRVVQAVARTPDAADPHRRPDDVAVARDAAISLIDRLVPARDALPATAVADWRMIFPHIDAFAGHSHGLPVTANTVAVMDRAFRFLQIVGNPAAGIRIAACALAGSGQLHGEDHRGTLASRNNLASAYEKAGDSGRAIPLFERTLADRLRVLGEDDPDTLASATNLAGAYESAGDLPAAIPLFEWTLAKRIRALGEDHPDTLGARNNLASAYRSVGDLGRAIPLLRQTVANYVQMLGEDDYDTLEARNSLAHAYFDAGDLRGAISLFEQTLRGRVRTMGVNHPHTLGSRNNLATAYQWAGDLGRAIPLFERTLAERIRVLGAHHPDTLGTRAGLAAAVAAGGDLGQAIPQFERTLAESIRVLGADHPDTLAVRNNLASAYRSVGDPGRAITLFEQTVAGFVRVLGENHPSTLLSRHNLAHAYESAGDLARAIRMYQETLAECVRALGEDHPHSIGFRNDLAAAYVNAGDLGRAVSLFEQTLAECIRVLGEDHPFTRDVGRNLAIVYRQTRWRRLGRRVVRRLSPIDGSDTEP